MTSDRESHVSTKKVAEVEKRGTGEGERERRLEDGEKFVSVNITLFQKR